jgi:pimeloyl-ACP methyl ester carboxylesterase
MRSLTHRITAVVLALAALAASAGGASAQQPPPTWQACPPPASGPPTPNQECAAVTVPLDYAAPQAGTIEVAVSRLRTAKPELRRGVLLLNPGGPGGAGLDLPGDFARLLPASVLDRYDLVGFDPRGVGRSSPVTCDLSAAQQDGSRLLPWPAPGGFSENAAFAYGLAQACAGARTAALLPFMTTANTARDMDEVRAALGEEKISYLGYSYGSYLGTVYTSLFPDRSDRFVLDSNVSPRRVWREMFRSWGPAIEVRFPDFASFAAERNATYGLGATPADVRRLYFELGARLDRSPLTLSDGTLVTGNLFREVTRELLYSTASLPDLAELWQLLNTNVPTARQRVAVMLATLFPDVPGDNSPAALLAVVCADAQWPEDPERYRLDALDDGSRFPLAGAMAAGIWPCAYWPFEPREAPVTANDRGPRNVLLVQGLRDPATPYDGALELRALLADRSRLVTADVGGHAISYGIIGNVNSCANAEVTAFLLDGVLRDRSCPADPPARALATAPADRRPAIEELSRRMRLLSVP